MREVSAGTSLGGKCSQKGPFGPKAETKAYFTWERVNFAQGEKQGGDSVPKQSLVLHIPFSACLHITIIMIKFKQIIT